MNRLTPFSYHRDGTIGEIPDLAPELDRSDEHDWDDVDPTHSTLEGVSSLMENSRAFGVTFMIPRSDQRPWNQPVGYCNGSIDVLSLKKKRKKAESLKEARADPSEDEREAARTPREPRDDDEMEEDRENVHEENFKGLSGKGSSGGELQPPSEATRQAVDGTPDISKLMFPDKFAKSARCCSREHSHHEVKNALRAAVLDLQTAEATIKAKEAEPEVVEKEKFEKVKEVVAECGCHYPEHQKAIMSAAGLEEELETAQSKISLLEKEKVEESERTKRAMEQGGRVAAAATRRLEKFWKYMDDRDKSEEKLILQGQALGTLQAMELLENRGMPIPRQLKDLLTTN
ncbi:hypothetical protein Bca52824_023832 [Brassica carinata]|uniref:Uncharacterized protein n=1 Tax=Brassica carinata TaxID=52824 RepID=A0A8X7VJ24_BRACI|nr:hypothetical protein Bca52824_023832 [Brassica carinata]